MPIDESMRCTGTKRNGEPCGSPRTATSAFCSHHDPAVPDEVKKSWAKSGALVLQQRAAKGETQGRGRGGWRCLGPAPRRQAQPEDPRRRHRLPRSDRDGLDHEDLGPVGCRRSGQGRRGVLEEPGHRDRSAVAAGHRGPQAGVEGRRSVAMTPMKVLLFKAVRACAATHADYPSCPACRVLRERLETRRDVVRITKTARAHARAALARRSSS